MSILEIETVLPKHLPACFLALFFAAYLIRVRFRPGLRSIPGPWLAKYTDIWRAYAVYCGRFDLTSRRLHERHGNLVRVGPNCISIGDPHEIPKIYGIQRIFPKVSTTPCWRATPSHPPALVGVGVIIGSQLFGGWSSPTITKCPNRSLMANELAVSSRRRMKTSTKLQND